MGKFKGKLINKAAVMRLSLLLVALFLGTIALWLTLCWMPGQSYQGPLPPLRPEEIQLQARLKQNLQTIAVEMGSRNSGQYDKLNATKAFLEKTLGEQGYVVKSQPYQVDDQTYYNLEVEKRGTEYPNEVIVIGAHYDSAFTSPGANDNGTGTVAVLELARIFAEKSTKRTLRFVEFTNEEPPFFWTDNMGSLVYARQIEPEVTVVAMFSLETMGYFSDEVGSQKYPFPLNLVYPNQGNFIAFIGNLPSGNLVRRSLATFRDRVQFPAEGAVLPGWVPGVGWSDHWAFWQEGYPAIMITDTAPYRYPYYHTLDDRIDFIDFDKLTRVVSGLVPVIADLGDLSP